MGGYKQLANNFYSMDLYYGKTSLKSGRDIVFYFIVQHPCSEEFLQKQVLQLFMSQCQFFHFYGRYSGQWCDSFQRMEALLNFQDEGKRKAYENHQEDMSSFVSELSMTLSTRAFVPFDVFLVYDDEETYKAVLNALKKR